MTEGRGETTKTAEKGRFRVQKINRDAHAVLSAVPPSGAHPPAVPQPRGQRRLGCVRGKILRDSLRDDVP